MRILLLKLGAIGDVVMAIPAAHALHQRGYQVDWVCGPAVAPLLRLYPWINVIPLDDSRLRSGNLFQRVTALLAFWRSLRRVRYELCATLYYDRRYRLLTLPVRAVRRLALSRTERATCLLPGRHHTDEFARILLGHLPGAPPEGETQTQLSPVAVAVEALPSLPVELAGPSSDAIVLVPAGARNALRDDALRRWPITFYVALAEALLVKGHAVVLAGGPDDGWASPHFQHLAVTNVIGKLSLLETLALLDAAHVTVTHDTGPLHLAGLVSTAIVALFGPTDPHGRLPHRANAVALWGGVGFACRPCYDGSNYAPCTHNGCLHQVTPAMVLEQVEQLLLARREGRLLSPRILMPEANPQLVVLQAND
jgi:heptosyltransferase-2